MIIFFPSIIQADKLCAEEVNRPLSQLVEWMEQAEKHFAEEKDNENAQKENTDGDVEKENSADANVDKENSEEKEKEVDKSQENNGAEKETSAVDDSKEIQNTTAESNNDEAADGDTSLSEKRPSHVIFYDRIIRSMIARKLPPALRKLKHVSTYSRLVVFYSSVTWD